MNTSSTAQGKLLRVIEPGVTAFSSAEVHVAVVPIGDVPTKVIEKYYTLITKHRQVELQSIQPFYTEQQKSPFKFFPWKYGTMNFRFLPEDAALKPSPLTALHTHRNVLGVIGICHCPTNSDLSDAYAKFETTTKQFPGAMTLRCFGFQPSDEQVAAENSNKEKKANLMMFPPTDADGLDELESHASFLMLEFAAALLGEIERWMLTASPAMIDLATFVDTSDKFLGPSSMFGDMQKRFPASSDECFTKAVAQEMVRKRRYGRLQKAMGDFCLLAGSPADAADHYTTAAELSRNCNDSVWCAAAFMGLASAKVLEECLNCGAMKGTAKGDNGDASPTAPSKRMATLRAASQVSTASTGFGGQQFWELLRGGSMELEARHLFLEARSVLPKRGGLPLQVEADLQLARLLAGLHGTRARREVSEMASSVMEAGVQMSLLNDRLTVMMEAAQILGLVGSARKRTLVLWQAVEFSRAHEMTITQTLQIARKALEPPDDPREIEEEPELLAKPKPLGLGVPQHWSSVRCACIEGVLSTAILASKHADVWDAAALLLREHWRDLPQWRQESLLRTLEAASNQMGEGELRRAGPGPPPLITFKRAVPPSSNLQPRLLSSLLPASAASEGPRGDNPFIYNPAEAKDKERSKEKAAQAPAQWICGETATVEVEIWNPTSQAIKVERVTVEAEHVGDPSVAPRDQHSCPPAWKPFAFSMSIPPNSTPSKVQLTGVPLEKGLYTVTGCTVQLNRVSWHQPWSLPPPSLASSFRPRPAVEGAGGLAEARVTVTEPLPLLRGRLKVPPSSGKLGESSPPSTPKEADDAPAQTAVLALKGQILSWELGLQNAGKLGISEASMSAGQQTGKADTGGCRDRDFELKNSAQGDGTGTAPGTPRVRVKSPALKLHLSNEKLLRSLPLKSQAVVRLPIMMHAREVAGYEHEEDAVLDFRVAYHGGRGAPMVPEEGEVPPTPDPLARCLSLPAHIRFLPSLQVNSLAFFEHHEAPGSCAEQRYAQQGLARRRCVVEADVQNRAPLPLQVWIGARVVPEPGSAGWKQLVDRPRPWQPGGSPTPGAPANVACKIIPANSAALVAAFTDPAANDDDEMEAVAGASTSGRHAEASSSRERRLAIWLQRRLRLYWRREDLHDKAVPVEIGALPLPLDTLERALDPQTVDLLAPAQVAMEFSARGAAAGSSRQLLELEEELLIPAGEEVVEGEPCPGAVWGYSRAVGEPLHLSMHVVNGSSDRLSLDASISCHGADIPRDMQRPIDDPNVLPSGLTHGVSLTVRQGDSAAHSFAVCFLLPGVYQLYPCEVALRSPDEAETDVKNSRASSAPPRSLLSVRPVYVLAR